MSYHCRFFRKGKVDYDYLKNFLLSKYLTQENIIEIINRDRLLRNLVWSDALQRVVDASKFYIKTLANVDLVVGISVDCYHTHILKLLADNLKIQHVGISSSFLPQYTFITSTGELASVSDARKCDLTSRYLGFNYIPRYMIHYKSDNLSALRNYFRSLLRIAIKKHFLRHLINIEYYHVETSVCLGLPAFPINPFRKYKHNIQELFASNNITSGQALYIPLQWYPEHNTDYWLPLSYITYEQFVIRLIHKILAFGNYRYLLIKDHPAMRGFRSSRFIDQIFKNFASHSSCYILDSRIPQSDILNICKPDVLSLNSSAAHEAVLRNLNLITHSSSMTAKCLINDFKLKPKPYLGFRDIVEFDSSTVVADNYLRLLSKYHLSGYCSEVHYGKNPNDHLGDFERFANSLSVFLNNVNKVA
jgi:hypothetical protein